MGLVTVFCPLTTTGAGELAVQTAEGPRLVVDCRVKPVELDGHVKIAVCSRQIHFQFRLMPKPELPPTRVVPYNMLLAKSKVERGLAPSTLVELGPEGELNPCKILKPEPSVLTTTMLPGVRLLNRELNRQ
jgi:hypothetical protein